MRRGKVKLHLIWNLEKKFVFENNDVRNFYQMCMAEIFS